LALNLISFGVIFDFSFSALFYYKRRCHALVNSELEIEERKLYSN